MQSIVVGTDGSASAAAAVRRGTELASWSGALLHLVTAYPDVSSFRERIGSSAKRDPMDLREVAESVLAARRASSGRTMSRSRRTRGRGTRRR
jgi:nucleotide-binding universal stress UspA family protein